MPKILMVDDEKHLDILIRQKFRKEIKSGKYDFIFARNGREALERIDDDNQIELVISDINMPEMDGLALLEHLDRVNPHIKTIIASAYNDVDNVKAAMDLGAYEFITKPIDLNDLSDTINRTMNYAPSNRQETLMALRNKVSLKEELEIASKLQQSILPTHFPDKDEVQLYATMRAAQEIGGDFYDYFWISPSELGIVIADVSGKGISAALFMGMARTLIKMVAMSSSGPAECLRKVNQQLVEENTTAMFVTLFYGILNITTGEFCYSNGGHCSPYIINGDNYKPLDIPPGLALGVMTDIDYTQKAIIFTPKTSLFLYTDGVTEAMNRNDIPYTDKRLENSFSRHLGKTMHELVDGIVGDVKYFVGSTPPSDDLTCLAMKYRPYG